MRIRSATAVLLALLLSSASSWASICDLSCGVNHSLSARLTITNAHPSMSFGNNMAMAGDHMDHRCCQARNKESAITAPHHPMAPDYAQARCVRLQVPVPPNAGANILAAPVIQLANSSVIAPSPAETPPLSAQAFATANPAAFLSSILRI
jgi:hypothetical protein